MMWLLDLIPGGGITALGVIFFAALGALGWVSRKSTVAERNRNKAKEAAARAKNLNDVDRARRARDNLKSGSELHDPNNRDNRI